MSDKESITLTKEQFQDLLTTLQSKPMNPLEQKKFEEEMEREKRRNLMQTESARIEMEKQRSRKFGCTHSRDKDGNAAPRGQGTWTTQGQVHGDDTITLICLRCAFEWHFKGTSYERDAAVNAAHGLLGMAPPEDSRLIQPVAV